MAEALISDYVLCPKNVNQVAPPGRPGSASWLIVRTHITRVLPLTFAAP